MSSSKKRNLKSLSFGDEAQQEEDSEDFAIKTIQSSHDLLKNDVRLSVQANASVTKTSGLQASASMTPQGTTLPSSTEKKVAEIDRVKAEILRVKKELVAAKKKSGLHDEAKESGSQSGCQAAAAAAAAEEDKLPIWKKEKLQYLRSSKAIVGKRPKTEQSQSQILAALDKFKSRLEQFDAVSAARQKKEKEPVVAKNEPEYICALHSITDCKSCRDTFGQPVTGSEEMTEEGWQFHRLKFEREAGERDIKLDPNELVVIDPREKAHQLVISKKDRQ